MRAYHWNVGASSGAGRDGSPSRPSMPPFSMPKRPRSSPGCNLTQAVKNLGCSHGLGFPGIETRDPARNFRIPSGVCAGFRIRLNADKEPVSKGNPLIRRKNKSVVRQGLKCCWHARTVYRIGRNVEFARSVGHLDRLERGGGQLRRAINLSR